MTIKEAQEKIKTGIFDDKGYPTLSGLDAINTVSDALNDGYKLYNFTKEELWILLSAVESERKACRKVDKMISNSNAPELENNLNSLKEKIKA